MDVSPKDYRRIYVAYGMMGKIQVFNSEDHFLIARMQAYSEEYFRFPWREIQVLKLRESRTFFWTVLLGSIMTGMLLALGLLMNDSQFFTFWMALGMISTIIMVVICLRGPGTFLTVKTMVSTREFYIGRRRKARKLMIKLNRRIREAQGDFNAIQLLDELRTEEKRYRC